MPGLFHRLRLACASPAFSVALILPLAALYFGSFHMVTQYKDFAYLGIDTIQYQAMAVNVLHGHGINRIGGAEPFEVYAFGSVPEEMDMSSLVYKARQKEFMDVGKNGGTFTAFRMPLYPLFMATVYKIFGIHPLALRNIQLLLLALVSAGLPLLGWLWWKEKGCVAGLMAGIPALALTMRFANEILIEAFAVFILFLCVLSAAWYQKNPSAKKAVLLGALLGICLLTKLSLILLPFIFLFLLCVQNFWHHKPFLRDVLLIACTCFSVLLPWSLYASMTSRSVIIFSTESLNNGLFDAHNEFTASNGSWHPEWRENPQSIYFRDGMEGYPDSMRIANFYWEHPNRIARLPLSKLVAGFTTVPSVVLLTMLLFLEGYLGIILVRHKMLRALALVLVVWGWWRLIEDDGLHLVLQPAVNSDGIWAVICGFAAICIFLLRRFLLPIFPRFPLMATAVIANFLFITVLVMTDAAVYPSRHVKVADFLFILLLSYVLLDWIAALFIRKK